MDCLPTRETWFCLYQPQAGGTAYLYEYDVPIDNAAYKDKVAPELRLRFCRPARDCYLHVVHGESFSNCDETRPPWYCYRVMLSGVRVGQRLGPYAADDIVAPNRVLLPRQERWRNNVRDIRDVIEFLAVPSEDRLTAALNKLIAVAHQDDWRSGPAVVYMLLTQNWGHEALQRYGITAETIRHAYASFGARMRQDGSSGSGDEVAAVCQAARRRRAASTAEMLSGYSVYANHAADQRELGEQGSVASEGEAKTTELRSLTKGGQLERRHLLLGVNLAQTDGGG
ncbi:hypothetical protein VOLCADRAFT_117339 [Volvox carteri f. nagariensis]|uniref:Uncharacterized protein n=1 Tax=Volvox carteri f. nagariensis TaxID=3068 RepID=D8TTH6_VOLCA|nr:uncharacterized protein VOLCADRAFT_117339 [Volvox carteri f. nagariensis]EFJ49200.1 hypothetical protein VOLCADRAFT_117339 [Volvox carteri f. nagariensis]|eukprot:XP_002949648.1 hypothetical protein VOLCADRAFT_117339 [Volvox carteri f. nagariensis]